MWFLKKAVEGVMQSSLWPNETGQVLLTIVITIYSNHLTSCFLHVTCNLKKIHTWYQGYYSFSISRLAQGFWIWKSPWLWPSSNMVWRCEFIKRSVPSLPFSVPSYIIGAENQLSPSPHMGTSMTFPSVESYLPPGRWQSKPPINIPNYVIKIQSPQTFSMFAGLW